VPQIADYTNVISWEDIGVPGAEYYVEESTNIGFTTDVNVVYSGPNVSVSIQNQPIGTYFYRVKATVPGFIGSAFEYGQASWVVSQCPKVEWLSVPLINTNTNTITWADSGLAGASYKVVEATDPTFTTNVRTVYLGTGTSVAITNQPIGTYYYQVRTEKAGFTYSKWVSGNRSWSVAQCPESIWLSVPLINTNTNTITWADSGLTGASYKVVEATDPGFTTNVRTVYLGTGTSVDISNQPIGTYYYRVRTEKAGFTYSKWVSGNRSWSVAQCPESIWLSVPLIDTNTNTITWADSGLVGASYKVVEATDPGFTMNVRTVYLGTGTSMAITNQPIGTYYYQVRTEKSGFTYSKWVNGNRSWMVTR
jgi:hypothetical protein